MTQGTFKTIKVLLFVGTSLAITFFLYGLVFRVDFGGSKTYQVEFDTIGTIMVGSPVRKAGVKTGTVTKLAINPENQRSVIVTFTLYPGQEMKVDDSLAITTGGILGDQFIDVFPGAQGSPLVEENHRFLGEKPLDFRTLTTQGGLLLSRLNDATGQINDFFSTNQATMSRILNNLEAVSLNLADMTAKGSSLNRFVETMNTELVRIIARTDALLASASPALTSSLTDLSLLSANLKRMAQGLSEKGSTLNLLQDPLFTKELEDSVKSMKATLANLEKITAAFSTSLEP